MPDQQFEPEGSVGDGFIEPRADPIMVLVSGYGGACLRAGLAPRRATDAAEFDKRYGEADVTWLEVGVAVLNLRREARAAQAAAKDAVDWLTANKMRLHAAGCSVHEPSARCSCGLHRVLSYTRAIANGNAVLFCVPPNDGVALHAPSQRVEELLPRLERAAWRMGELWERCQGKGWPDAESEEFTKLRDERVPALRAELRAACNAGVNVPDAAAVLRELVEADAAYTHKGRADTRTTYEAITDRYFNAWAAARALAAGVDLPVVGKR